MTNITNQQFYNLINKINHENKNRNKIFSYIYNNLNLVSYSNYFSLDCIKLFIIIKNYNKKKDINLFNNLNHKVSILSIKNKINKDNTNILINNSIKNSFIKFKNPIITPDIFLFTYLNEIKNNNINTFNLDILNYKLLQQIYKKNLYLKKINKINQFFILLLNIEISEFEITKLNNNNTLKSVLFIFRNLIYNKININNFKNITKIKNNFFLINKKKY